jgi:hypothetical protein
VQVDPSGTIAPYAALGDPTQQFGPTLMATLAPGDALRLVGCLLACRPLSMSARPLVAPLALSTAAMESHVMAPTASNGTGCDLTAAAGS